MIHEKQEEKKEKTLKPGKGVYCIDFLHNKQAVMTPSPHSVMVIRALIGTIKFKWQQSSE